MEGYEVDNEHIATPGRNLQEIGEKIKVRRGRTPPLIRTVQPVPRVSGIEGFYCIYTSLARKLKE